MKRFSEKVLWLGALWCLQLMIKLEVSRTQNSRDVLQNTFLDLCMYGFLRSFCNWERLPLL